MKKEDNRKFRTIYPNMRYVMGMGRSVHRRFKDVQCHFKKRPDTSPIIPDAYNVCNSTTIDSELTLNLLAGEVPKDLDGNLYICQCLGTPEAFMVGDTNLVKMNFGEEDVTLKNRMIWNPAAMARLALEETKHRFDYYGLMFLSPGLGMFSYMEGMYLLPDGRLGITSDVDRPWIVERDTLRCTGPLGKRKEWLPMVSGSGGEIMGALFSGYSNSHVIYTDTETNELFLVNYQYKQQDGTHPCYLMKWDGEQDFKSWSVVEENGEQITIMQSIHELIFTRDYILLADTAFIAGMEMLAPWNNAPLPNPKTIVYVVDRRHMIEGTQNVVAKRIEVDEACIHLIAEYENPDDLITLYMLHTPATNTAEIIKSYDVDMDGRLFPEHLVGYGTLPVLDLSSVGKHVIDMKSSAVSQSDYLTEVPYCWGPYMYTYMGRQMRPFQDQDLFVMFKGFSREMLPKRIYKAYKDVDERRLTLEEMLENGGIKSNNSIARITKEDFKIADAYTLPDRVLLYTISCLESNKANHPGYVIAGIVHDVAENTETSGHEYWIFKSDELAQGPICKLGHKSLNNSVLFHTVYIPKDIEAELDKKEVTYQVPLREDYPAKELRKWEPVLEETFEEVIWPYYDNPENSEQAKAKARAEAILESYKLRRVPQHGGREHLIEEVQVTDAAAHADRMIAEANRIFATTGWQVESAKNGVTVESKPVDGVFKSSDVCVTRARGIIQAPAKALFDFITSPKGYAVIDPVCDPDDHAKEPLEVYEWRENCRLEAALAGTNIPGMKPCDFVVLNAIDGDAMVFASKSILHDSMPGGSKYSSAGTPDNGHERALNTFVIKIEPIDEKSCLALCINYADMAGKTSAGMNNFINKKVFFNPLYKRMHKAAKEL